MEEQLRSMKTIEQTIQVNKLIINLSQCCSSFVVNMLMNYSFKEENDKLQSDLKEVRLKLNKQVNERTLLDNELKMCKEEGFFFSLEKVYYSKCYCCM